MSKQEKRYFKIVSRFHSSGKENDYIKIFDSIDKWKGSYRSCLKLTVEKKEQYQTIDNQ
jgi:hypothetical protein